MAMVYVRIRHLRHLHMYMTNDTAEDRKTINFYKLF